MKDIVCSGALFYALNTRRFLFLHRAGEGKRKDVWGLVGGNTEDGETPFEGLKREIQEEIGQTEIIKTIPLETFVSNDTKFLFHTYLCVVRNEFIPELNREHDGYSWVSFSKWPKPLHYGLQNTLNKKVNLNKLETVFQLIDLIN